MGLSKSGTSLTVDIRPHLGLSLSSMNSMIVWSLRELTKDFPALTGVSRARRLLAELIIRTAEQSPKGTLVLNFDGVDHASASFLRESVLAFRDYARAYQPELFPVL